MLVFLVAGGGGGAHGQDNPSCTIGGAGGAGGGEPRRTPGAFATGGGGGGTTQPTNAGSGLFLVAHLLNTDTHGGTARLDDRHLKMEIVVVNIIIWCWSTHGGRTASILTGAKFLKKHRWIWSSLQIF